MKFCILASGSKGNCVYLEYEDKKILIDLGVSFKQIKLKLMQIDVNIDDLTDVFITHEHADHVMGLRTFSNQIKCNFHLTQGTFSNLKSNAHETLSKQQFKIIKAFDEISIGNGTFLVVPTHHDAKESVGFKITYNNKSLVYITDTGYIDIKLYKYLLNANVYILESNYDPEILYSSQRTFYLKKRIAGDLGHMSNEDSAINLTYLLGESTSLVIHAHISLECNSEQLILETFRRIFSEYKVNTENIKFVCAKQYEISEVYEI